MTEVVHGELISPAEREDDNGTQLDRAVDMFAVRLFGDRFPSAVPEEQNFMRRVAADKIAWLAGFALAKHDPDNGSYLGVITGRSDGELSMKSAVQCLYRMNEDPSLNPIHTSWR